MSRIRDWLIAARRSTAAFLRRHAPYFILLLFALGFVIIFFFNRIVISIYPGELRVLWRRIGGGTVVHTTYEEGLHLILPINKMYVYNVRKQRFADSIDVLTLEGLMIHVEYSARFNPSRSLLPMLHQRIGPDYVNTIVRPEVRSVIRSVFVQYKPEEIYTTQKAIQERVSSLSKIRMEARYVSLDDVPIELISLPPRITAAIESKLTQYQLDNEYLFRLSVAKKEAERKQIEADGQKAYNDTVSQSLNPMLLQWQGILATRELALSTNTKVIVIGQGKDGLPIILGGQ